jgi:hypothetical protein
VLTALPFIEKDMAKVIAIQDSMIVLTKIVGAEVDDLTLHIYMDNESEYFFDYQSNRAALQAMMDIFNELNE